MYLEHASIIGFRGINRINLSLDESTLLIGENAWGKTSLLEALTLFLSLQKEFYQFTESDFHHDPHQESSVSRISLTFTYCESITDERLVSRYSKLTPIWVKAQDENHHIYYHIVGEKKADNSITTTRFFLDEKGQKLTVEQPNDFATEIIRLHPLLRLRYSGLIKAADSYNHHPIFSESIRVLTQQPLDNDLKITEKELYQSIDVIYSIFEHYFSNPSFTPLKKRNVRYNPNSVDWRSLQHLNHALNSSNRSHMRFALLGIFAALLGAANEVELSSDSQAILLIEEPESRLHPTMLSVAWGMLTNLPLQKITTTNSGELLSLVSVEQICRMVRRPHKVATYRVGHHALSIEDQRRIAFHITVNRASSLFARCWLFVEGETEVWLLNEQAKVCNYHLKSEGIKIIEFAQCGLKPLIKLAENLGIEWHVLVDGDSSGKKYAATARSLIRSRSEKERLTVLPAQDIEYFMYKEGFGDDYKNIAALPEQLHLSPNKVIQKAIKRTSKPDLAIAIAEQIALRGADSIPAIFIKMFDTIIKLSRNHQEPDLPIQKTAISISQR